MPMRCGVCASEHRTEIDSALLRGSSSLRDIAGQYGLTKSAVARHKQSCTPAAVAVVEHQAQEGRRVATLADSWADLHRRARSILATAEKAQDHKTALSAVRELTRLIALAITAADSLKHNNTAATPIEQHAQWPEVIGAVCSALEGHPEALAQLRETLAREVAA